MSSFIEEWMNNKTVNQIDDKKGNHYGIRVLGRGTDLFFKENNRGLICSIDAVKGVIYKQSIKIWDSTGEKMSKAEKERVSKLIEEYYKKVYNPVATLQ